MTTNKPAKENPTPSYFIWGLKNIAAVAIATLVLVKLVEPHPGYDWAYNKLLKSNMETIKQYPNLTLDQRFEMKLGFDYSYLNYMKKNTPENAVILYPGRDSFFPEGKESPFKGDITNKLWATRFLYPRKLILPQELETSPYKNRITHVAIVNGKGFDKLNFKMEPFEHGVVPLNQNK